MAGTNDIIGIAAAIAKSVPGTAGAAAVAAKEAAEAAADEAQEILESIPEDYSELSADVSDLKSATSEVTEKLQKVTVPASSNIYNVDLAQTGYVSGANGQVYTGSSYDSYRYSAKMPVTAGDTIYFYQSGVGVSQASTIACYNASDEFMPSASSTSSKQSFTIPEDVVKIIITITATRNSGFMALVNISTAPQDFIPYSEAYDYYIADNGFIPDDLTIISNIKSRIDVLEPTADSSDVGKFLKVKTVEDGIVTEYEFGTGGAAVVIDDTLTQEGEAADAKVTGDALSDKVSTDLMQKCQTVEKHTDNYWDKSTATTGYVGNTNGRIYTGGSYDNYKYSTKIPVAEGDIFYFREFGVGSVNAATVACYDSSDQIMGSSGTTSASSFTVPQGVSSIIITVLGTRNENFMALKNNSTSPTEYIPCKTLVYYVAGDGFIPDELITPDKTSFAETENDIILNVPSKIYATEGIECNVYFENITEDWEKYKWDITCNVGMQLERGFRITPQSTDAGTYTITFAVQNEYGVSKQASSTLVVTAASAGSGTSTSIIILGDSTTAGGTAVEKIHANFENDTMAVSTLGTNGTSPNNHEGRSGWTFNKYFTESTDNPFYNPSTQTFDAAYYFASSGVSQPDWFIINLGINDMFSYTSDTALNDQITSCISKCNSMISSIRGVSTDIKVCVCLTIPPNHSQDAFGKAYNCGQTRNRYKRNNALWVKKLIETYDNRTADGIYIIPLNAALDTIFNMGMESMAVNSRNTSVTYQSPVGNGGVHPVESGYWQIADMYTAFLKGNAD